MSEASTTENHSRPGAFVLFLRDNSTPSLLIEQSLSRAGHQVTDHQHPDELLDDCVSGRFDVVLLDHSLPLNDRLSLVRRIRSEHPSIPVVLVFNTNAEQEVAVAKTESVSDCVIQDRDGAYLFKIPDLIARLMTQDADSPDMHRTTPSILQEDVTDVVDLSSIVKEVKGAVDSQKAAFVVLAGQDVGHFVQLEEPLLLIGRDASCHMRLKSESISRFHASIKQHSSGVVTIRDLNSTNGTFIDGKRIQIEELEEGAKILLGKDTVIRYQTHDALDKNYYDELYLSSTRDELTGVYNRRFCMERINTDISFAKRHDLPVSLIMFDVDHFKRVNDTYGHLTGDTVLTAIARVSAATLRQEDVLGRFGGEEFVVFALDTDLAGATALAERIRRRIEREEIIAEDGSGRHIRVTVSLGVTATSDSRNMDARKLIAVADENLYEAKAAGRNCLRTSEMSAEETD